MFGGTAVVLPSLFLFLLLKCFPCAEDRLHDVCILHSYMQECTVKNVYIKTTKQKLLHTVESTFYYIYSSCSPHFYLLQLAIEAVTLLFELH